MVGDRRTAKKQVVVGAVAATGGSSKADHIPPNAISVRELGGPMEDLQHHYMITGVGITANTIPR